MFAWGTLSGHVRHTRIYSRFSHDSQDDPVFKALEGALKRIK